MRPHSSASNYQQITDAKMLAILNELGDENRKAVFLNYHKIYPNIKLDMLYAMYKTVDYNESNFKASIEASLH